MERSVRLQEVTRYRYRSLGNYVRVMKKSETREVGLKSSLSRCLFLITLATFAPPNPPTPLHPVRPRQR